jgi:poly-gamma-glutamate synthesis protein (capsule biosynthesis protein)
MPTYPFNPESRHTMIGCCRIGANGEIEAGFFPCWIDDDVRPVPLGPGEGDFVVEYVDAITREAGLETSYRWDGDVVRALTDGREA